MRDDSPAKNLIEMAVCLNVLGFTLVALFVWMMSTDRCHEIVRNTDNQLEIEHNCNCGYYGG